MGDLAVRFGFYGGGWDGDLVGAQDEAGEALTISDTTETWFDCLFIKLTLTASFLTCVVIRILSYLTSLTAH